MSRRFLLPPLSRVTPVVPPAVPTGLTPVAHGLYRENVLKVYGIVTFSGGTPTLVDSFNVTSITDTSAGQTTFTVDRDFTNTTYTPLMSSYNNQWAAFHTSTNLVAGSFLVVTKNAAETDSDVHFAVVVFGDQ